MSEHVIAFVSAPVGEIFAFEDDSSTALYRQIHALVDWGLAAQVGAAKTVEFRMELGVRHRLDVCGFEFVEGRQEEVGDFLSAEAAEIGGKDRVTRGGGGKAIDVPGGDTVCGWGGSSGGGGFAFGGGVGCGHGFTPEVRGRVLRRARTMKKPARRASSMGMTNCGSPLRRASTSCGCCKSS